MTAWLTEQGWASRASQSKAVSKVFGDNGQCYLWGVESSGGSLQIRV